MRDTLTNSKQGVKSVFGARATEWATFYADPEPRTLQARNLVSRQRFALEMVEAAVRGRGTERSRSARRR